MNFKNYECRQDNSFFIPNKRSSYLFNSSISGIDDSDLCVIVGSDIRKEAPIIGARLRRKSLNSDRDFPVIRVGHQYNISLKTTEAGETFDSILNLQKPKHQSILNKSKKPLFIIGQGPLCSDEGENLFNYTLNLYNNIKKDKDWNGFNILQNYSGRVGALDLGFFNKKFLNKNMIKDVYNGKFEILYLFGADELEFDKIPQKTFVIYHGHHGDNAASRADVIIPAPCFTEKDGIYVNLEGRVQVSKQVKMPIANVYHSCIFFKKLSEIMGIDCRYHDISSLRSKMFEDFSHLSKINMIKSEKIFEVKSFSKKFSKDNIISNVKNFYMTDAVSRNSPTMSSCSLEINNKY